MGEQGLDPLEESNRQRVKSLHNDRIRSNERNFIQVVVKNDFEKLTVWVPESWFGQVGWVFAFIFYHFQKVSKSIIRHPAFEILTIMVILANS